MQRFIPRVLDGLIIGFVHRFIKNRANTVVACGVTGLLSALLNTLFFMTALVLLFGNTEYMQGLIGGRNIILFACAFVGVNSIAEMVASTIITSAVGTALAKARLINKS